MPADAGARGIPERVADAPEKVLVGLESGSLQYRAPKQMVDAAEAAYSTCKA